MREIKFRGMMVTGKWVYGDLYNDREGSTAYWKECSQRICWDYSNAPVKNGTVGQYIGLKDKDGAEIYEDDLVLCGDGLIRQIWFSPDEASFKASTPNVNKYIEPLYMMEDDFKVIGNIHDNPEFIG